jgi:hypothetical protein
MIRKPSSGLDAVHTVGDFPGWGSAVAIGFHLRTQLAPNTPALQQTGVHDTYLLTKVRMASRRKEGTLVPQAKVSHASRVRCDHTTGDANGMRLTAGTHTLVATDRARSPPAWVRPLLGTVTGRIGTEPGLRRTIPTSNVSDFTRRQPSGGPLVPSSPLRPEVLRGHEK